MRPRLRILLLGPPGSGKGTQGEVLARRLGVPQVSTGEMLRGAVAAGSELGRRVRDLMDAGLLVDDATMLDVVRERLGRADAAPGFLLDGYPRTLPQALSLDEILEGGIDSVLLVEVPEDELVRRMVARGRSDDTPEVARERQRIYREATEPLVGYYEERDLVHRIDGRRSIPEVTAQMVSALGVAG
ncbi:MAG TPA: adenylate kinase [Thermoanaerobaculia bacterium]|nr:adenylate kinase [Thermoanaerobaculia bacterium]